MLSTEMIDHIKRTHRFPKHCCDYVDRFTWYGFSVFTIVVGSFLTVLNFKFSTPLSLWLLCGLPLLMGLCMLYVSVTQLKQNVTFVAVEVRPGNKLEDIADKLSTCFDLHKIEINNDLGIIRASVYYTCLITLVTGNNVILLNCRPFGISPFFLKRKSYMREVKQILTGA